MAKRQQQQQPRMEMVATATIRDNPRSLLEDLLEDRPVVDHDHHHQRVLSESLSVSQNVPVRSDVDTVTRSRHLYLQAGLGPLQVNYEATVELAHHVMPPHLIGEVRVADLQAAARETDRARVAEPVWWGEGRWSPLPQAVAGVGDSNSCLWSAPAPQSLRPAAA